MLSFVYQTVGIVEALRGAAAVLQTAARSASESVRAGMILLNSAPRSRSVLGPSTAVGDDGVHHEGRNTQHLAPESIKSEDELAQSSSPAPCPLGPLSPGTAAAERGESTRPARASSSEHAS